MNKTKLKTYAPQARKDFIAAVTARAHRIGLAEKNGSVAVAPAEKNGDFVIIAGQSWPAKISRQRDNLIALTERDGFSQTMEAVAYTWFNRFAALRYMEIHDYLSHGYRVLSSREGGLPEILNAAPELAQNRELPDLKPQQVIDLKLAGDQDGELYRLTLIAQCNALSSVMPFLFERIDNETELLLPDNLLLTDSVIAKLVGAIPEEDWSQVEIIGWLYQFYISEKKDQVIGNVVKSEDIPAATQLFTPNWIVQYLVQNSVGRLWLMANPASTLKSQWPYYIEPAEQTTEVGVALAALIQTRMDEDGGSLNPESITVLDPACGSGHILVEAYDVLKAIYLERGYQLRSIPRLILEKNLFGLDIDDRAAQLAGFALLMKARSDDRRLLDNPPKLNVLALQESKGLDADEIVQSLNTVRVEPIEVLSIRQLIETFAHAKTFGSLIQIPLGLNEQLSTMDSFLQLAIENGDLLAQAAAQHVLPLVRQTQILGMQFDVVVANPPYMGGKFLTSQLKTYLNENYKGFEKDLFSAFMIRNLSLTKESGQLGFMSPFVWMFISSYEKLRQHFIDNATLTSLIQLEYSGFDGATVPICTFTLDKAHVSGFTASYIKLSNFKGHDNQAPKTLEAINNHHCGWFYSAKPDDFKKISGSPIAYWVSDGLLRTFESGTPLGDFAEVKRGMTTTSNNKMFLRFWPEVSIQKSFLTAKNDGEAVSSKAKWFPYSKGGGYRKWFGFLEFFINWEDSGHDVIEFAKTINQSYTRTIVNIQYYFLPSVGFSYITSGPFSMRWIPEGCLYDSGGPGVFTSEEKRRFILGFMNSSPSMIALKLLNPTINLQIADVVRLPLPSYEELKQNPFFETGISKLLILARSDWNAFETSWDFTQLPLLSIENKKQTTRLSDGYTKLRTNWWEMTVEMQKLEEENNRIFIEALGLEDELSPDIPLNEITLTCNPHYRYGGNKNQQELETLLLTDSMKELVSFAIGCMMGRYSLDELGLIYAHTGNVGFDSDRYHTFPADADGIVPITDEIWFEDDAANRIREFLLAVWNTETLDENIAWLAESLGQKGNETPIETIRRYIAGSFFKDHLQTYKKRPIYWLFSSGKQGAFQALVYLHRYHESTLARMRAEYVVPLTGKIQARIEMLENDAAVAASNATRSKLNKDIEKLKKKHVELLPYDEKLRHYADLRIQLDLDDGVKVNYGKFGDLLAEVKAVTGGAND